jgi:beta-glucanase (GH16 family)
MVAWWMVGLETSPEQSSEICVAEIFGDAVDEGRSAAVGMGLHPFRDPAVREDFDAVRLPIDVASFHRYAVRWDADAVAFFVDGVQIRTCLRPPTYPMQMMLAVFDFPARSRGDDGHAVPELVVDSLRAFALS